VLELLTRAQPPAVTRSTERKPALAETSDTVRRRMSVFDKFKNWLTGKASADGAAPETPSSAPPAPQSDRTSTASGEASAETSPAPSSPGEAIPRKRWTAKDDARVESEARDLFERGDGAGGIEHLAKSAILFARHETTTLPCLCAKCLRPGETTAEAEGVPYVRDFVVTRYRVLFYWTPSELAGDAGQLRASMRSALRQRLRVLATKEDLPRQGINPFTNEPITILPKQDRRVRINPFTGKPVP
jgi:hypothetical protein